jgi:hypothetical protein
MDEGLPDAVPPEQRPPTWAQVVEGYLALALVGLMFAGLVLRVRLPEPAGIVVGVTIWGLAWLFALSGVRRGRGGARAAAWVSLGVLVWHAGMSLLLAYH